MLLLNIFPSRSLDYSFSENFNEMKIILLSSDSLAASDVFIRQKDKKFKTTQWNKQLF